ncbi:hypothetical protein J31TS6_09740 [Brevibacillus reuszeri]|nr:hypothetical protein J31TS6_09740 [Brevibacillus reuszeri]
MTMKMTTLRALGKSVFLYDVVSVALAGMASALVDMALASPETALVVEMVVETVVEMALAVETVAEMVVEMATWALFQVAA